MANSRSPLKRPMCLQRLPNAPAVAKWLLKSRRLPAMLLRRL